MVSARFVTDSRPGAKVVRPRRAYPSPPRGAALAIVDLSLVYVAIVPIQRAFGLLNGVSTARQYTFICSIGAWVVAAAVDGLYSRETELDRSPLTWLPLLARAAGLGSIAVFSIAWGLGLRPPLDALLATIVISFLLTALGRAGVSLVSKRYAVPARGVILGSTELAGVIAEKLARRRGFHIEVMGAVADAAGTTPPDLPLLGSLDELDVLVQRLDIRYLFVSGRSLDEHETLEAVRRARGLGVDVYLMPAEVGVISPDARMHWIEGLPVIGLSATARSGVARTLKRGVDLAASATAVAVLLPLLVAIAIGIKLDSPGSVLYRHRRLGRDGKPFDVLKFRTMHQDQCRGAHYGGEQAEEVFAALVASRAEFSTTYKFADDPRVTRFGRVLRHLSLDELPQFLNVLAGDLSLVGPRPITEDELPRYHPWEARLLQATPGMTGYWQVNGRSHLSYDERVQLDMAYIDGWSPRLDAAILAKTPGALRSGGSY